MSFPVLVLAHDLGYPVVARLLGLGDAWRRRGSEHAGEGREHQPSPPLPLGNLFPFLSNERRLRAELRNGTLHVGGRDLALHGKPPVHHVERELGDR